MRVVADENIDSDLVSLLRQHRYEVLWISETAPSINDWEELQRAVELGAVLITEDKGISRDIFDHRRLSAGGLLLRVHGLTFPKRAQLVLEALNENRTALEGKFGVLTNRRLRIRPII